MAEKSSFLFSDNVCDVACGGRRVCVNKNGKATCVCEKGYTEAANGLCIGKLYCDLELVLQFLWLHFLLINLGNSSGIMLVYTAISGCKNQCGTKRTKTGTGCSCHSSCARDYNCCSDYWTFCEYFFLHAEWTFALYNNPNSSVVKEVRHKVMLPLLYISYLSNVLQMPNQEHRPVICLNRC